MRSDAFDLTGKRFGRLTVIKFSHSVKGNGRTYHRFWECKCDCGNTCTVRQCGLTSGRSQSCGCLSRETSRGNMARLWEGKTNHLPGKYPRLYRVWAAMKRRCSNKNCKDYPNYGGRGITVCEEWRTSFDRFCEWAISSGYDGELTLDRIDYNGNYTPSNCRWIPMEEQSKNRRPSSEWNFRNKTPQSKGTKNENRPCIAGRPGPVAR